VEPEGEVAEMHVAVANQLAKGVAQADGAQRGGVDQAAGVQMSGCGRPQVGIGAVKSVVQGAQRNDAAAAVRADAVVARRLEENTIAGVN
jgi:hypothetical protein